MTSKATIRSITSRNKCSGKTKFCSRFSLRPQGQRKPGAFEYIFAVIEYWVETICDRFRETSGSALQKINWYYQTTQQKVQRRFKIRHEMRESSEYNCRFMWFVACTKIFIHAYIFNESITGVEFVKNFSYLVNIFMNKKRVFCCISIRNGINLGCSFFCGIMAVPIGSAIDPSIYFS